MSIIPILLQRFPFRGSVLLSLLAMFGAVVAQGQTQTSYGGYTVQTWTSGSTTWTIPANVTQIEYLIVGGGGGGGFAGDRTGGGGGGGEVRTGTLTVTPGSSVSVWVGSGGSGGTNGSRRGGGGGSSGFASITASGGGGGGAVNNLPSSGGGGFHGHASIDPNGGVGFDSASASGTFAGGGGAGAGAAGGNGQSTRGGHGGSGVSSSLRSGSSVTYGGGGGGGFQDFSGSSVGTSNRGNGGSGGGGSGGYRSTASSSGAGASSGSANTGGGGGGGATWLPTPDGNTDSHGNGGSGGSGIVVIRYVVPPTVTTTAPNSIGPDSAVMGGNVTSSGGTSVTARGVVWSTSTSSPTLENRTGMQTMGSGTSSFSQTVTGLSAGTRYYVRAYATNSGGTSYGGTQTFTTMTNAAAAQEASNSITITYASGDSAGHVTQNLGLPTTGLYDSTISWTSSNENLIRVSGGVGDVFRPWDGDKTVTLTATTNRSGATTTRTFTLTVKNRPVNLSNDSISQVLPQKLHVDDTKRITVAGSNFRAYVDKSQIDFQVVKGSWSQSIPRSNINIVSDTAMVLIVPVDPSSPLGNYTLLFNHKTLSDITRTNAYEITNDPKYKAQPIRTIELETDNPGVGVKKLTIMGEFDQIAPGQFEVKEAGQTVIINNVLKLKVSGKQFSVDTRSGRQKIEGTGTFMLDSKDRYGRNRPVELYSGQFELNSFDMEFKFTGDPKLADLFGQKLNIGAQSMQFSSAETISMSGVLNFGINIPGALGLEVDIQTLGWTKANGFNYAGTFDLEFPFKMGPFEAPRLHVGIDTLTPQYSFGAGVTIPKHEAGFDLDFIIKAGNLDKITLSIRKEIQVPSMGYKINSLGGGAENISDRTSGPLTFLALGDISDMVSPELRGNNMLNFTDLRIGISKAHLDASGSANFYGLINLGSAEFVGVWNAGAHPRYMKEGFELTGVTNILDVIVGKLNAAYWRGEAFRGLYDANLQIPNVVPLIGGKSLSKTTVSTDAREARAEKSIIGIGFVVKYIYRTNSVGFDVSGALKKIAEAAVAAAKAVAAAAKAAAQAVAKAATAAFNATKKAVVAVGRAVANVATAAAKAVFDVGKKAVQTVKKVVNNPVVKAGAKVVKQTTKKVGKAIGKAAKKIFFCTEGRDAISIYVDGERFVLIEVTGLVSEDFII